MQKKITPLTHDALRVESSERQSATLLTPAVASLPRASRFVLATYPMTLPGSQGVSMPSFITIGSKLWALEGYKHTYRYR